MIGYLILALIIVLVVLVVFTPVRIIMFYERVHEKDHLTVEMTAWFRLIRYKYEIPVMKLLSNRLKIIKEVESSVQTQGTTDETAITKEKIDKWIRDYRNMVEHIHDFFPTVRRFMKQIQCKEVVWQTSLGIGDAAATGTLTGVVWSIKSLIIATLSRSVTLQTYPRISVQPVWNEAVIHTKIRCILMFRVGHAILAGIRLLLKLRKGRVQKLRTTPSRA